MKFENKISPNIKRINWILFLLKSTVNKNFSDGFRGDEFDQCAQIRLIFQAKFGNDHSYTRFYKQSIFLVQLQFAYNLE